jgi:hypothetical protein
LDATHNGHEIVTVQLRNDLDPYWKVEGEISIDPGEELSRAVRDLETSFR